MNLNSRKTSDTLSKEGNTRQAMYALCNAGVRSRTIVALEKQ